MLVLAGRSLCRMVSIGVLMGVFDPEVVDVVTSWRDPW
jgi:hypothetical protein